KSKVQSPGCAGFTHTNLMPEGVVMVRDKVREVDELIRRAPWMDFEFGEFSGGVVAIVGSVDPSSGYDLKILFSDVAFVSLPVAWRTDTSRAVLSLVEEGRAEILVNHAFHVVVGNTLFEFAAEDLPGTRCLIGAREIDVRVLR